MLANRRLKLAAALGIFDGVENIPECVRGMFQRFWGCDEWRFGVIFFIGRPLRADACAAIRCLLEHAFHVKREEKRHHENDGVQNQVSDRPIPVDGPFFKPPSAPLAFAAPEGPDRKEDFDQVLRRVVRVRAVEREFSAFRADIRHSGFP
jgi:hypothetical protein